MNVFMIFIQTCGDIEVEAPCLFEIELIGTIHGC